MENHSTRSINTRIPKITSRIRNGNVALPLMSGVLILCAWQLIPWWYSLPAYILPQLSDVIVAAYQNMDMVLGYTGTTLIEVVSGFIIGALIGFVLAVWMVAIPLLRSVIMPIYVMINSVPPIAYGPLAIIWFGIGPTSKSVLIVLLVSYTVLLNTLEGLLMCSKENINLLRSFGASKTAIFVKLQIPSALPWLFQGLRVSVVQAVITAVVLEMLGARSGIGWGIFHSTQMINFVDAWMFVLVSVAVSLVIYSIVNAIGRRLIWW